MIGTGYEQFMSDFNIDGVGDAFANLFNGISEIISSLKS